MHEDLLRRFFLGNVTAEELEDDLRGSLLRRGNVTEHVIIDMSVEFQVTSDHLVRVCDAVLGGQVSPAHLRDIGFCLQASDCFVWDGSDPEGERISETAADWSAPEINHQITIANVERWRHYLLTGEYNLGNASGPAV